MLRPLLPRAIRASRTPQNPTTYPVRPFSTTRPARLPRVHPQPAGHARDVPSPAADPALRQRAASPYFVERTLSDNLPVYNESTMGASKRWTLIRKIQGGHEAANALRRDIIADLGLAEDAVVVNHTTQHVSIKGPHRDRVKAWLLAKGF